MIVSLQTAGEFLKEKVNGDKGRESSAGKCIRLGFKILKQACRYISFIFSYNRDMIRGCKAIFYNNLIPAGTDEVALYGISDITGVIIILAEKYGIRISGIYDNVEGLKFRSRRVSHYLNLKGYHGKVLISSAINPGEKKRKLRMLGIKEEDILIYA